MTTEHPEFPTKPGLYPDVPADEYHRWPYASQSLLKVMRNRSPLHAYLYMHEPPEPTPALKLGDAVHVAVLQPELFGERFAVAPEVDRRTKKGREAWEAFLAENEGKTILSQSEWETCIAIRDSVLSHPTASKLIDGPVEQSALWKDKASGVMCKGRFDVINRRIGAIVDLKTCLDASPKRFTRDVYNYGYWLQGAMYINGAHALDIPVEFFVIVAVEKEPPYAVAIYNIMDEAIIAGESELGRLLQIYAECERTGVWPAYPVDPVDITLPPWGFNEIEEAM